MDIEELSVELWADVKEAMGVDGFVVILEQLQNDDDPRNVLAFKQNANRLCEIEPVQRKSLSDDLARFICFSECDGQIVDRRWNSYRYDVN